MNNILRYLVLGVSALLLILFYIFQKQFANVFDSIEISKYQTFVLIKSLRFIINDLLMVGVIYGLFGERKYVIFALWIQLLGIIFILLPYLVIKYYNMGYNGPLINFLHRLVLNPLLMILIIPAIYYQKSKTVTHT